MHLCIYVYMYISRYMCLCVCAYTYRFVYIYIYIYIYIRHCAPARVLCSEVIVCSVGLLVCCITTQQYYREPPISARVACMDSPHQKINQNFNQLLHRFLIDFWWILEQTWSQKSIKNRSKIDHKINHFFDLFFNRFLTPSLGDFGANLDRPRLQIYCKNRWCFQEALGNDFGTI